MMKTTTPEIAVVVIKRNDRFLTHSLFIHKSMSVKTPSVSIVPANSSFDEFGGTPKLVSNTVSPGITANTPEVSVKKEDSFFTFLNPKKLFVPSEAILVWYNELHTYTYRLICKLPQKLFHQQVLLFQYFLR